MNLSDYMVKILCGMDGENGIKIYTTWPQLKTQYIKIRSDPLIHSLHKDITKPFVQSRESLANEKTAYALA